jgi:hypothetical protein
MRCLPATQFCCGFSTACGVKFILLLHLAVNICFVTLTFGNLVGDFAGFRIASYGVEMVLLGYCVAGIPLIIMAFSGVNYRNEVQVRLYHYYIVVTVLIVLTGVVKNALSAADCTSLPSVFAHSGEAWACGMARWLNLVILVFSLSIISYFQHVVYSYCEDLAECGGGPELSDLVFNKEEYLNRYKSQLAYNTIEGMSNLNQAGWLMKQVLTVGDKELNADYESGPTLFGHSYHDTEYPPSTPSAALPEQCSYRI